MEWVARGWLGCTLPSVQVGPSLRFCWRKEVGLDVGTSAQAVSTFRAITFSQQERMFGTPVWLNGWQCCKATCGWPDSYY